MILVVKRGTYLCKMQDKPDIRKLTREELEHHMVQTLHQPRYRTDQVWQWLWQKGASHFNDMSNLPLKLREKMEETFSLRPITIDKEQVSADGTIKTRFQLFDGHCIESVLIPVPAENRYTVCVSSQVGCSLSCSFCATGKMARVRNLDPGEIFDQVFQVNRQSMEHFDHPLTNIVFMGMGEPLLAYRPVMQSIVHITSPEGLHMSPRRITVSTAGIAKMISKLADEKVHFNLALSLHAADDDKRNQIMPINEQNNLEVLREALAYFYDQTRSRITLEYIAFKNYNDSIEDARKLASFIKGFPAMVNIIEYNPVDGVNFTKSEADTVDRFAQYLSKQGVDVTVRRSRGKDIDAACGQLANKG